MNRKLVVERLYSLGSYQNIKFVDAIEDLPERLTFNKELLDELKYLQMIDMELAYRKYVLLLEKLHSRDLESAVAFLEEQHVDTLDQIKNILYPTEDAKSAE